MCIRRKSRLFLDLCRGDDVNYSQPDEFVFAAARLTIVATMKRSIRTKHEYKALVIVRLNYDYVRCDAINLRS